MSTTFSFDPPGQVRRPGIIAGVVISVLLHAVLLFGYRLSSPPTAEQPAKAMTVWLQPLPPPKTVAKVEPPPPPPPRKREPREPVHTAPRERTPAPAIAEQVQPTPAESQAITLPPAADPLHPEQQPKQFDMNAALKTARGVAKEKAPAGTLAAQLEAHPINPEPTGSELAKKMEGAKKTDCLKSASGAGLLAPLFWALDKHCKF